MVEIFTPAVCLIIFGAILGFAIGFGAHALWMRWYLRKNMVKHPEYKFFLEILDKKYKEK